MKKLIFVLFLAGLAEARAADTGPVVFDLDTKQVTGFFIKDPKQPKIVVKPEEGVSCRFRVRRITEHRAPAGYRGWHVELDFRHPAEDQDKQSPAFFNFFWNGQKSASPFAENFAEEYDFFDPIYDPPSRRKASFDREKRTLVLDTTDFGGLVRYEYRIFLAPGRDAVEKINYVVNVMGTVDTNIDCVGHAKIAEEK